MREKANKAKCIYVLGRGAFQYHSKYQKGTKGNISPLHKRGFACSKSKAGAESLSGCPKAAASHADGEQRAGQECKHPHRDDKARESPGGNPAVIREVYEGKKELPAVLGASASGLLDEKAVLISSLFQDS